MGWVREGEGVGIFIVYIGVKFVDFWGFGKEIGFVLLIVLGNIWGF